MIDKFSSKDKEIFEEYCAKSLKLVKELDFFIDGWLLKNEINNKEVTGEFLIIARGLLENFIRLTIKHPVSIEKTKELLECTMDEIKVLKNET